MDTSYLLEQLQTDWPLPGWREVVAAVRKQFGLIHADWGHADWGRS